MLVERVKMDMRHARVEETVEAFDQADNFDVELICARDRSSDRGVQGRGVTAGGEDANAFHGSFIGSGFAPIGSQV